MLRPTTFRIRFALVGVLAFLAVLFSRTDVRSQPGRPGFPGRPPGGFPGRPPVGFSGIAGGGIAGMPGRVGGISGIHGEGSPESPGWGSRGFRGPESLASTGQGSPESPGWGSRGFRGPGSLGCLAPGLPAFTAPESAESAGSRWCGDAAGAGGLRITLVFARDARAVGSVESEADHPSPSREGMDPGQALHLRCPRPPQVLRPVVNPYLKFRPTPRPAAVLHQMYPHRWRDPTEPVHHLPK